MSATEYDALDGWIEGSLHAEGCPAWTATADTCSCGRSLAVAYWRELQSALRSHRENADFSTGVLHNEVNRVLRMTLCLNTLAASACSHHDRVLIDANAAQFLARRQQEALYEAGYRIISVLPGAVGVDVLLGASDTDSSREPGCLLSVERA